MLFAYLVDNVQFSPEATKRVAKNDRTMDDLKRVFAHRSFRFGLGALALYIVGHTVLWGFSVRYSQSVMPVASGMVPANSDCGRFTHSSSAGSSELV